jgi:ketosteroid isomerase-like protein
LEVLQNHDETIVRFLYDGTFDRTNLPQELIFTDYIRVRDGKIVSLVVIRNQPSPY